MFLFGPAASVIKTWYGKLIFSTHNNNVWFYSVSYLFFISGAARMCVCLLEREAGMLFSKISMSKARGISLAHRVYNNPINTNFVPLKRCTFTFSPNCSCPTYMYSGMLFLLQTKCIHVMIACRHKWT